MRLLGLVLALILAAGSLGQERRCDGDCSDKAPLPPGEGAATPSPPPAAAPAADDKQRRPPPPPDEAKPPPPVESDVALHFTNHVHVTLNDTWDPPGHVHRDVVVENGSSLNYAASFLSHTVTDDDGEEVEPATPASVLNNTIALGEDASKVKVLLDSSNNLKEPDLFHDEDSARAAKVQTPSTVGKLEADTTTALPEAPEQQSSKNTTRETINKEEHPPEIVVTQEPSKNLGTDLLPDVIVTEAPIKNNSNISMSVQEHEDSEKAEATSNNNKTDISTRPSSARSGGDSQERRSSTRLVLKKVTKAGPEDDDVSSTPLPRENKIYHGSSRRRTQEVTTVRPRRRGTTTPQPEASMSSTLRSFRRKSYTDATSAVETTTPAVTAATRRRPSEEDSEETMVRVELSTLPSRRSSRPPSTTTTRSSTSSTVISSSSSVSTSRGRVKFSDSNTIRTTTTPPSSGSASSSMVPMRRLLLPPTPSPGTRIQEPRPFSMGMQENKHVAVHVPAPPTTTEITTTEEYTTSSSTVLVEDAWTAEDAEDSTVAAATTTTSSSSSRANTSSEKEDDDAPSTTTTWPVTTTATKSGENNAITNEPESTFVAITDAVTTTDRPEELSTVIVALAATDKSETQQDDGEDESTAAPTTTTVTTPYETLCYATLWASPEELCRRLTDVRDAFLAALKANTHQDGEDNSLSGWEMSLRLQEPRSCEGQEVTSRPVEVSVRGIPDGCMHLLDLWTTENLASPLQVRQFRVPGVEPPAFDGHSEDSEDHNATTTTTAAAPTTTTTSSVSDEDKTTLAATTTEEVPPPALSGGGGDAGNNAGVVAAIVVSSVGGVCLVLLAVLLVVLRRRQRRFRSYGQRCTPVSLDAYSLDSVSVGDAASVRSRRKGVLRASKRSYGNAAFTLDERDPASPSHPLTFAGLAAFCADDDNAAIQAEFALVPQVSVASDELPPGADVKNRYANVTPLPETRVQLTRRGDDPISTYINANYVKGPEGEPRFYIATQAPMASTVTDFWRMVWEQQSRTILMATLLVENGVERCCDYLPPSEVLDCHRVFGDFQITLKKRDQKDHYVVSTLQIKNLETNLWREVTHLWLVSWPCEGVPEDPRGVIAFLVEARPFTKAAGPVVVHCSPGTGRTGTLIACDVLLRHFETTRTVDVPRCVAAIRRERAGAVKTPQQYVFIYKLLNLYAAMLTGGALDSL